MVINGPKISKLASTATHLALRQMLYAIVIHNDENHSLIQWLMVAYRLTWHNKSVVLINTGLWTSMEELQNYIRELCIREAIYEDSFDSPDTVRVSVEMKDLILQQAPSHLYGTSVSILHPLVALEVVVQQASQLVAELGETECL